MLLPTWNAFAKKTKTTIVDVADYTYTKDDYTYSNFVSNKYKGVNDSDVDLFYSSTKYLNAMGLDGKALDLTNLIESGYMPNLKKFLDNNPIIKRQITTNGKIYYTPYFDGYDFCERSLIMDTAMVEKVLNLNNASKFDITTQNGGLNPSANVVQSASYTPFICQSHNYPDETTILSVLTKDNKVVNIEVKQTKENIITMQNKLLSREGGATGKELALQFIEYLADAYGAYVGEEKLYSNYAEIFTSVSAAYNADELIALMRVIKANPGLITGDASAEIETLFPRGEANNRVENILDFMQIWGIQGLTSEKDNFYFGSDGKLHALNSTAASYEAVNLLGAIYKEGLILDDFSIKNTGNATAYLDKYFKKTTSIGYGFMMYDYTASTTASNDQVNGLGTNKNSRKDYSSVTSIAPVLPPVTWWANKAGWSDEQSLYDMTGKSLIRYTEDVRGMKSSSWCILADSKNPIGAARLMDYMYSDMGSKIQSFGPEEYWDTPKINDTYSGIKLTEDNINSLVSPTKAYVSTYYSVYDANSPVVWNDLYTIMEDRSLDFWTASRTYLGSTFGIGHVRMESLDTQSVNQYAIENILNMKKAVKYGVVQTASYASFDGTYTWNTPVPSLGSIYSEYSSKYQNILSCWNATKLYNTYDGWTYLVCKGAKGTDNIGTDSYAKSYTLDQVKSEIADYNNYYIVEYAKLISSSVVPQLKQTA